MLVFAQSCRKWKIKVKVKNSICFSVKSKCYLDFDSGRSFGLIKNSFKYEKFKMLYWNLNKLTKICQTVLIRYQWHIHGSWDHPKYFEQKNRKMMSSWKKSVDSFSFHILSKQNLRRLLHVFRSTCSNYFEYFTTYLTTNFFWPIRYFFQ